MKANHRNATPGSRAGFLSLAAFAAIALYAPPEARAATLALDLDSASSFAILAGAGITIAGPAPTTIVGDIGSFPTISITGLENLVLTGTNHGGDAVTQLAKTHLSDAFNDASTRAVDTNLAGGSDLMGMTLLSGVYFSPSSLFLTGAVTLDAMGDPNAVWIIRTGSTLITANDSVVSLINGARAENVFWQVGSSATLGTFSDFSGSILASESITLTTGATISGRALALNGEVTMDNNTVIPEPAGVLLVCAGLGGLFVRRRRSGS